MADVAPLMRAWRCVVPAGYVTGGKWRPSADDGRQPWQTSDLA